MIERDPREVLSRPAPPPDVTLPYGPRPEQVIDIRLPRATPAPLVVVVHGGFWRAEYDRGHTGPMASALADAGYLVAVPEFRRIGSAGGGWPGTFDDVAAALDAVPESVASVAPYGEGPGVWVGHSAGGHLALWAAARHRLPRRSPWYLSAPPPVGGVVALAGCCDLLRCSNWRLGDGAADDLIGGPPRTCPERYAVADPARLVPLGVPVTLLHGSEDDRVPVAMSREYAARARAVGDAVELVELPGVEHFAVIDPLSVAWRHVLTAIGQLSSRSAMR